MPDPPAGEASGFPTMIWCHGWKGDRSLSCFSEKLCRRVVERGIAFVTFDFFGCGETGGDYSDMTYRRWRDNPAEVLAWTAAQDFSDETRIGCAAFSPGSTAALRLAAGPNGLAYLVSVGTCASAHIGMAGGGPGLVLAAEYKALSRGGKAACSASICGLSSFSIPSETRPFVGSVRSAACSFYRTDARLAYDVMRRCGLQAEYFEPPEGEHGLDNVADEAVERVFSWLDQYNK